MIEFIPTVILIVIVVNYIANLRFRIAFDRLLGINFRLVKDTGNYQFWEHTKVYYRERRWLGTFYGHDDTGYQDWLVGTITSEEFQNIKPVRPEPPKNFPRPNAKKKRKTVDRTVYKKRKDLVL